MEKKVAIDKRAEEIIHKVSQKEIVDGVLILRYLCSLCSCLMVNPIQTARGCSACGNCYDKACEKSFNENGTCPIDNEPILSPKEYFRDRALEKDILNLSCYCLYKDVGCNWKETVRGLPVKFCLAIIFMYFFSTDNLNFEAEGSN